MSPIDVGAHLTAARFPRTRGDEPSPIQNRENVIMFSPHARG